MTTESTLQSLGLSLLASAPLVAGGEFRRYLTDRASGYIHTIEAFGGYKSCSFSMSVNDREMEDWLENGIGRHIVTRNPEGVTVWEGFVNQIDITVGSLSISVGPLINIANRVYAVYTPLYTGYTPATTGQRTTTAVSNDATSQGRYGIWQKSISAGQVQATQAAQVQATFLQERAYPATSQKVSAYTGSDISVKITCRGYFDWLYAYTYNQTATSGTVAISALLQTILAASPNAIFSTDYSRIATNAFATAAYENDDKYAGALIKELVAIGDAANSRYTFGFYNDRRAVYAAQPTTIAYQQQVYSNALEVKTLQGEQVHPWDVLPAQWLQLTDLLVGRMATDYRRDPRLIFIESVTYSAPHGLTITGGKTNTLAQLLAKIGPGGVSA